MHPIEIYEVVKKLVGPVVPVGETNEDNGRFENLKVMTDVIDRLLFDIDSVCNKDGNEFSIKRAREFASEFLNEIGEVK